MFSFFRSAIGSLFAAQPSDQEEVNITSRPTRSEAVPPLPRAQIRVDTELVLVPVTVSDPLNRFVTGLDRDVFRVYEDKVEQKLVSFGSEDTPLSIGIVF